MIRSMYHKMQKYKDAQSLDKQKQLQSRIRRLERERDSAYDRALKVERIVYDYETYKSYNDGVDINLASMAKEEKKKFRENNRKHS